MVDLSQMASATQTTRLLALTRSAVRAQGGAESTAIMSRAERVERLERALRSEDADADLAAVAQSGAAEALEILAGDEAPLLTLRHAVGLEAVVLADGTRPVLSVAHGQLDLEAPEASPWGLLRRFSDEVHRAIAATGSVVAPVFQGFAGTAVYVAENVVLTNRHVLEAIAQRGEDGWRLRWPGRTAIDFEAEGGLAAAAPWMVAEVLFAGGEEIGDEPSVAKLDVALLRVVAPATPHPTLPPPVPLQLNAAASLAGRAAVFAVGVPGRPPIWTGQGPPSPVYEAQSVIAALFKSRFGRKRVAPGLVTQLPDDVTGGLGRVFAHDCSTLGGSSGSSIVDLGGGHRNMVGLHFAGISRVDNYAFSTMAIRSDLPAHPALAWT